MRVGSLLVAVLHLTTWPTIVGPSEPTINGRIRWATRVMFQNWLPYFQKSFVYTAPDRNKRAANATPSVDTGTLASGKELVSLTVANYAKAGSSWVQRGFAAIGIPPINGFISGRLLGSSYPVDTINATTQTRDSAQTSFLTLALKTDVLVVYQSTLAK